MSDATDLASFRTLLEACSDTFGQSRTQSYFLWCVTDFSDRTKFQVFLIKFPVSHDYRPKAVLPELRFPLLEHVIVRFPVIFRHSGKLFSSFPFLAPFFVSNAGISSHSAIHLSLHIHFKNIVPDPDFSTISAFLCLPVFRHPIVLYISTSVGHPDALLVHFHLLKKKI